MARRRRSTRPHRPLSLAGTHWRADGRPKTRYDSAGAARAAADERGLEDGVALNVYRCDFCRGWHMGGPAPREA
jgi:hypothetical protein